MSFADWFHAPAPPQRLALVRFGVGAYAVLYLLTRVAHLNAPARYAASAFAPVGLVSMLETPLPAPVVYAVWSAAVASGVAFTLGVAYRWAAPLFAASLMWVLSYRHSWGMIFHTDNLLAWHVVLLACAPGAGGPIARRDGATPSEPVSGWALRAMCMVTVASYFVAGVAKLEASGLAWAHGDALREQIAYDALRKLELGGVGSPLGPWLLPHGSVFPPLATFSLAAELLAPLALLGARAATVWCVCAWAFHFGVLALMAIVFAYPLSGVAFLSFFAVERWYEAALRRSRARRRAAVAEPAA